MQHKWHIRATYLGPIGNLSCQNAGKIAGRDFGQGIVRGNNRHHGIHGDHPSAQIRLCRRGKDQFCPARNQALAGHFGCGGSKTNLSQGLAAIRVA